MPLIRGTARQTILARDVRETLLKQLSDELAGRGVESGAVIFEIPLEHADTVDVLVVWQEFEDLRSEDRTALILEAYKQEFGTGARTVSQALGVTYQEAMEQNLLPYAVQPMARAGEADADTLRQAMRKAGGIRLPNEKVVLRFPTMAMAEDAHRQLCDALPRGYWGIVSTMAPVP